MLDAPASDVITTEVLATEARTLLRTLDELAEEGDDSVIRDFGHEPPPRSSTRARRGRSSSTDTGRDVGTVDNTGRRAHGAARRRAAADARRSRAWPILTTACSGRPRGSKSRRPSTAAPVAGGRRWNRRAVGHRPRRRRRGGRGSGRHPPPATAYMSALRARVTRAIDEEGQRRRGHGRWRHRRNYGSGATGTVTSPLT